MGVVYQGSMRARDRQWIFQLVKAGGTLISDDHDVSLASTLQWGEDSPTGFLDRFVMPASLVVEFTDPDSVIFDDLRTSGKNAFTLRFYDDQLQYQMDLFCRLADVFTPLKPEIETPTTRIIATCGLTRMTELDAHTTDNATTHGVFKALLVDGLRSQDIQYLFSNRNSRAGSSGAFVKLTRYPDLEYAYKGLGEDPDEIDTAGNQLTDFAEAYQCMVFMDLFYGGRWMVAQPWLLGIDHSEASRHAQLYDATLDAVAVNAPEGQLATLISDDKALRGLYDADRAVEVVISSKRDQQDTQIQLGSLLEGWSGTDNVFWVESGAAIFHETTEGGYIDDGGEDIYQDTILVKGGKWVRITLDFDYALEYTVAGAGNHQIEWQLIMQPLDPGGTVQYGTDAGTPETWTTTPTTPSDSLARTPDANGTAAASLTWRNMIYTLADYMPEDGYIRFKILGDTGNDYFHHIRNVHVELEDQAASAVTDTPPWPAHGTSEAVGGSVTEGPTVEYQRNWHPVIWVRSAVEYEGVEVDVTGTSLWGRPGTWEDGSTVGQAGPYNDLNELLIRLRLARGAGGRLIKGVHLGILTPATVCQALGGRYLPIYLSVDLHTCTTTYLVYEELLAIAS